MRRWVVGLVAAVVLVVGCSGGDGGSVTTTTAVDAFGLDPCALLPADQAAELVGADVELGGAAGNALACSYAAADDAGGAAAGSALAALALEPQADAGDAQQVLAALRDDDGGGKTVTSLDLGDGGVQVIDGERVQVVYVVRTVVVRIDVVPAGGAIDGAVTDKVVRFATGTVAAVDDAVPPLDVSPDDLVGTWRSSYGPMVIRDADGRLLATYATDDGTITLVPGDGEFVGWWTESPSRRPPNDAGLVIFRPAFDAEGRLVFRGVWSYGDGQTNSGWDLDVTDEEPPAALLDRFDEDGVFVERP